MLKKLTQSQQDTILERAVEEFGRNGLERAAISEIARRSGVSVGVIYKYYKNKEELFEQCLKYQKEENKPAQKIHETEIKIEELKDLLNSQTVK